MSEERREFAGFVQTWTQNSRNLLDQGLGSQEGIVLLSCEEKTSVGKDRLSAPTLSLELTAQLRLHCSALFPRTHAVPHSQSPAKLNLSCFYYFIRNYTCHNSQTYQNPGSHPDSTLITGYSSFP